MRRWWMKTISGGLATIFWLLAVTVAQAQPNNADITASAQVLRPLTVQNQVDLDFGNVFPGVDKSVAIADATAGEWYVTGATSAEVDMSFTLPANLSDGGGNNLPIAFGASDGAYDAGNNKGSSTAFDPAAGATANLSGDPTGELWVWIGGTVQPAVNQPQGLYTGTITLTVNYTGN